MINKVVGLHFSPYGGTATITEKLMNEIADSIAKECAGDVSCEVCDLFRNPDKLPDISDETVVVVGMPAIIGKLPVPAIRLFRKLQGAGAMTFTVVSYGAGTYGNALYELYRLAEDQGFNIVGAGAFISKFADVRHQVLKRPDMDDFAELEKFAAAASSKLKRLSGCSVDGLKIKPVPLEVGGRVPVHRISKLSPKAAFAAEDAIEKLYMLRKDPEWFL